MGFSSFHRVTTPVLDVAYEHAGEADAPPVILLHGFPYDVRAFDEVAAILAAGGASVFAPYLRGFGGTRFLDDTTPRSGQQAALTQDLLEFMDALDIENAVVAGYDWGGRAACIAAAAGWRGTGTSCANCCGAPGRPLGRARPRRSPRVPRACTTPTSSTS
jgi:pimeloyl-ACP methyl ester carboxylesterase